MPNCSNFSPGGTWYDISGVAGQGEPVVLIHGVGLDHTMWDPQVQTLGQSHQLVRYDMLGHGRTPASGVKGISSFVMQLVELLAHLEIEQLHLVGLSMGGVISQAFAGQFPLRLKTLILMNTVYRRTEEELRGMRERLRITREQGLAPIAQAAVDRWFDDEFKAAYPDRVAEVRQKLLANDVTAYTAAYAALVEADSEVGDALTKVRCPAMVLTGEKDVGSTPAIAQRMAADLALAEVVILSGLHHLASWEDPARVNARLLAFLQANS
jgi:pimeloyl-ACP methyl ester carboxylesterase